MSEALGTLADYIPDDRACVYALTNTVTGEQYIGSTNRLRRRLINHRARLRHSTHPCAEMISAVTMHGLQILRVDVLEAVEDVYNLAEREQHYIDALQPAYNKIPASRQPLDGPAHDRTRAKKRAASLKRWSQEGARERASALMVVANAAPGLKEYIGQTTRDRWKDPDYRAFHTERTREAQLKPDVREAKAKLGRETWESSGRSEKLRAYQARRWADPAEKEAARERMRKRWQDPAWRAHFAETQRIRKQQNSGGQE